MLCWRFGCCLCFCVGALRNALVLCACVILSCCGCFLIFIFGASCR